MASDKETKQNEYWRAREEEALRLRLKDEAEYQRRIDEIYADMLESCQSEIDRFYRKYAEEESISLAEAKKRVSRLDIEAYERKAARYVEEKNFSKEANVEMRLYNATMKINRLEMLKANIGLELISGHDDLEKFMNDILQGRTEDELKRQAGILGDTIRDNAKAAHSIVNASFQNATFSERIWMYQDALKADLSKLLHSGLIQGKNPRVLARELESKFGASKYNAERLMRTELARVQTDAQRQSFEKMGFEEYTFHANSNCCDACQALNGKHFKVKDMMPGENAAPIHPSCRCSCSAYEDSDEYEAWLDYLSKGGTTDDWNSFAKAAWKRGESIAKQDDSFAGRLSNTELSPHASEYKTYEEFWQARKDFLSKGGKESLYLDDVFAGKFDIGTGWNGAGGTRKIAQIENTLAELHSIYPLNPRNSLEYGTTIRKVRVCDYDNAYMYLPDGIGDRRLVNGAIGQVFENNGNSAVIAFDRYWMYQTIEKSIEERSEAISLGKVLDSVGGSSPQTVAMHEWGHLMSNHITNAMINGESTAEEYWKWYKTLSKDEIRNGLSDYATTNRGEFEAECFAELMMPNPRPLALKYKEYLDKCIELGY